MDKGMERSKSKRLLSGILTASFFMLSFLVIRKTVCVMYFNDDVYLSIYFSGAFSEKELCVPFINTVLALIMKALYSLFGSEYNLFYLFLVVVEICSFTVITFHFIYRNKREKCANIYQIPIALIFFSFFVFDTLKVTTFTKTAGISTAAGMLLLLECAERNKSGKEGARLMLLLGAGLCLTGFMLRDNMAVSVMLLMLAQEIPDVLNELRQNREKLFASIVKLTKVYLPVLLVLVCAVFLYFANRAGWSKEPYKSWEEFSEARAEVYDYTDIAQYSDAAEEYERLGISENDLRMIREYKISDAEIIDAELMHEIAEIAKNKTEKPAIQEIIQKWTKWLIHALKSEPYGRALLLAAIIYVFCGKHDREAFLIITGWFIVFLAETLFLVFTGRFGLERVDVSLYMTGFLVISNLIEPKEKISKTAAICALAAISTLCTRVYIYHEKEFFNGVNTHEDLAIEDLARNTALADSGYLFMDNNISFSSMGYIPMRSVPTGMCDRIIPTTSWAVRSPVIMRTLEKNGLENAYRDCVGREDVRIIDKNIETTVTFIREHYCQTAEAVLDEALYEQTGAKTYYIKERPG